MSALPSVPWPADHPADGPLLPKSHALQGELSHRDSIGNYESLPRGCVQYMSAGTGACMLPRAAASPRAGQRAQMRGEVAKGCRHCWACQLMLCHVFIHALTPPLCSPTLCRSGALRDERRRQDLPLPAGE